MPGCVTRPVWKAVEETVRTMFGKTTIGELARKLSVARSSKGPVNYAI
jgi:DNA-binding IscR family transcriptional regulator